MTTTLPASRGDALPAAAQRLQQEANQVACDRLAKAKLVLVDVAPALSVVPSMDETTILTSGAPLPWERYTGGQRRAILYAAVHEGCDRCRFESAARAYQDRYAPGGAF